MPAGKRLFIVEEGLRDLGTGHWYEHIKTIANICREDGVGVTITAHRKVSFEIIRELQAVPLLPESAWDRINQGGGLLKRVGKGVFHGGRIGKKRSYGRTLSAQPLDEAGLERQAIHNFQHPSSRGWNRREDSAEESRSGR